MKVIFMGTPDFSVGTLEALIEAGHEVVLAVTQPDKPKGRGGKMQYPPVKETALEHGIPVFQPKKIRDPQAIAELEKYSADVMVVIAFGQILPKQILEMTPYGCINVHASLLPKYRGAAPIQWAVSSGEKVSGVTTMQMDEGLDTGDILLVEKYTLDPKETGGSLFDKLAKLGGPMILKVLQMAEEGSLQPQKQDDAQHTYAKRLSKATGQMDFTKPAKELERLIRGLNPWPSAFCFLNGKMLKIWEADVIEDTVSSDQDTEAGMIVDVAKDSFDVKTKDGLLRVYEVQLEGKKRMRCDAFLRGFSLEKGQQLKSSREESLKKR